MQFIQIWALFMILSADFIYFSIYISSSLVIEKVFREFLQVYALHIIHVCPLIKQQTR